MPQQILARPRELSFGRNLTAHVERHLGPIDGVLHAPESTDPPIDLLWIDAAPGRDFQTFVTCGMSCRPMTMGKRQCSCSPYAELLLRLPGTWPVGPDTTRDAQKRWPLELLVHLASLPHDQSTHLGRGHTVAGAVPAQDSIVAAWPTTRFRGTVLREPTWASQRFRQLRRARSGRVDLFGVIPLYSDELHFAYEEGSETLFDHLDQGGVTDLLCIDRPNLFEPIH